MTCAKYAHDSCTAPLPKRLLAAGSFATQVLQPAQLAAPAWHAQHHALLPSSTWLCFGTVHQLCVHECYPSVCHYGRGSLRRPCTPCSTGRRCKGRPCSGQHATSRRASAWCRACRRRCGGSGCGVRGVGFREWGSGFGLRVWGSGCGVRGEGSAWCRACGTRCGRACSHVCASAMRCDVCLQGLCRGREAGGDLPLHVRAHTPRRLTCKRTHARSSFLLKH